MATILDWALWYHKAGICVIPVKSHGKAVDLWEWEEYQHRMSTEDEIRAWWTHKPTNNIGLVHGVNNFVSLDFDHDNGIFEQMRKAFPVMFSGRIEQSGSGEGYHIPLFVSSLPDLGYDNSKDRPKGNKTWKPAGGHVNIRARWCQTVAPPSIHPSGNKYRFIQKGDVVRMDSLDSVISWLNAADPRQAAVTRKVTRQASEPKRDDIKSYFPSVLDMFARLGVTGKTEHAQGGGTRICGHGGLIVTEDEKQWYNFSDETGGDVIDAVGWSLYGAAWNRYDKRQFIEAIKRMEDMAGLGDVRAKVKAAPKMKRVRLVAASASRYWG